MSNNAIIFISHESDDEMIALELKSVLEEIFSNVSIFVSGRDLSGGQIWIEQLKTHLKSSEVILSLLTPKSIQNNWVYFESGAGFTEDKTIPLLTDNLKLDDLKGPMSILQARLLTESGFKLLITDITKKLNLLREPKIHINVKELLTRIGILLRKECVLQLKRMLQLHQIAPNLSRQWIYEENCLVHDFIIEGGHQLSLDTYFYIDRTEIQLFDRSGSLEYIINTIAKSDDILIMPYNSYELIGERVIIQKFSTTERMEIIANTLSDILHRIDEYHIKQKTI